MSTNAWINWRVMVLLTVTLLALLALGLHGPIPQDPRYHDFSDQQNLWGIPHCWNVLSNAPFVLSGLLGIAVLARGRTPGLLAGLKPAYLAFFIGSIGIGFGSGWYHLHPSDGSLVWDRLPMTISFMAFVAIVIGEQVSVPAARRWLAPLILLGLASIGVWVGTGDLRTYALVQFLPLLMVPLILLSYPARLSQRWMVWALLAFYAAAKVAEHFDREIHQALGCMAGHALKHVLAAIGMAFPALGLRRPV